jgi:hypothetical protein
MTSHLLKVEEEEKAENAQERSIVMMRQRWRYCRQSVFDDTK